MRNMIRLNTISTLISYYLYKFNVLATYYPLILKY